MTLSILKKVSVTLSIIALASMCTFASAMTRRPVQRHRHHQVHQLNRHIAHQEQRAAHAWWNGNWWGALRHSANAQNLMQHKQHVQNKIHRTNRHWAHSHDYCLKHHLYC